MYGSVKEMHRTTLYQEKIRRVLKRIDNFVNLTTLSHQIKVGLNIDSFVRFIPCNATFSQPRQRSIL